jgi:hypothetical protein
MEYAIGLMVGIAVACAGRWIGLDRDRAFYATVLIVVAAYYALFGAMGSSTQVLEIEIAVGLAFSLLAVLGFKGNMWLVAAGIAGHGVFDLLHHFLIDNPAMPLWWPGFCAAADLLMGGWMAFLLKRTTYSRTPTPVNA